MKDVTNVLVVLFLIVGAGLVYAGKGECKTPETTVDVEQETDYYPSGRPRYTVVYTTTWYGQMYCEGVEGNCVANFNHSSVGATVQTEWWSYNDDSDDSNILKDSGVLPIGYAYGRSEC